MYTYDQPKYSCKDSPTPLEISEQVIASASVLITPTFVKTEYVLNIRAIALIKLANIPKIKNVCSLLKGLCIYKTHI
nr:MAG TPA: hypothetical protein [Caudoviricetes sp.]